MKTWITLTAAIALALPAIVHLQATPQQPQRPDDVRIIPNGQRAGSTPGVKGATYYALEQQSRRVTTVFADGTTATAERGFDGDVVSTLKNAYGMDINRVRVDRKDTDNDVVQYIRPSEDAVQAALDPTVRPTLDWANRQSHLFHRDKVTSGAGLKWRNGVIRSGRGEPEADELETTRSVETVWPNGFSAVTRRVASKQGDTFDGKPVRGDVLVTTIYRDGGVIGHANYFTYERIYSWDIPGLTSGLISNDHLKGRYGGWVFRPDMTWMNLQALGLFQWKTTIRERQFVSAPAPKPVSMLGRVANYFAPNAKADETGCDDLHWLDGTSFRFCCDVHDKCFEKYGCTSSSWWTVWKSWNCDRCNIEVVWCFMGGGSGHGPVWI